MQEQDYSKPSKFDSTSDYLYSTKLTKKYEIHFGQNFSEFFLRSAKSRKTKDSSPNHDPWISYPEYQYSCKSEV